MQMQDYLKCFYPTFSFNQNQIVNLLTVGNINIYFHIEFAGCKSETVPCFRKSYLYNRALIFCCKASVPFLLSVMRSYPLEIFADTKRYGVI